MDLTIIPAKTANIEPNHAMIGPYLDLSLIRRLKTYDKFGYQILLARFREYFLDGAKLTKERCEQFFSNEGNFV
jgi:hypothetical protein